MPRYRTILFDADNTLLDFARSEREAICDTLRFVGVTPSEEMVTAYSAINDAMWKKLERGEINKYALREARFVEFCNQFSLKADAARMATAYTDFLSTKSYLMDGALETCRALAGECRLYVITNGIGFVQHGRFDPSPISPYFSGAFISEEMGAEKPDRAYFDRVAAEIKGFDPATTLVVGDSLTSDMAGGVRAGLDTCWFNPRGAENRAQLPITYTVARLEDVVPIALGA